MPCLKNVGLAQLALVVHQLPDDEYDALVQFFMKIVAAARQTGSQNCKLLTESASCESRESCAHQSSRQTFIVVARAKAAATHPPCAPPEACLPLHLVSVFLVFFCVRLTLWLLWLRSRIADRARNATVAELLSKLVS